MLNFQGVFWVKTDTNLQEFLKHGHVANVYTKPPFVHVLKADVFLPTHFGCAYCSVLLSKYLYKNSIYQGKYLIKSCENS